LFGSSAVSCQLCFDYNMEIQEKSILKFLAIGNTMEQIAYRYHCSLGRIQGVLYKKFRNKGEKYYYKYQARKKVLIEKQKKNLIPEECKFKNKECFGIIDAHHYLGYKKEHWLDIWWVCRKHHMQLHSKNRLALAT